MKSAYLALFAEKGGEEASSLEHEWNPRREMVRIWRLNIPPKVRDVCVEGLS